MSFREKYSECMEIAEGTGSRVFRGINPEDGSPIAIKLFLDANTKRIGIAADILREIAFLNILSHKNIISLIEIGGIWDKNMYAVLEFAKYTLGDYIYQGIYITNEELKLTHITQILEGVAYLHDNTITHRDLKPANILVTRGEIKICDFNFSCLSYPGCFPSELVTWWYRPPELIFGSTNYEQTPLDIWSIGCILGEMEKSSPLFSGNNVDETLYKIFDLLGTPNEKIWPGSSKLKFWDKYVVHGDHHPPKNFDDEFPSSVGKLISGMLQYSPMSRLCTRNALEILSVSPPWKNITTSTFVFGEESYDYQPVIWQFVRLHKLSFLTMQRAVNYAAKYTRAIQAKHDVQLVAMASILIAGKLYQADDIVEDLEEEKYGFSKNKLEEMEKKILEVVGYNLYA